MGRPRLQPIRSDPGMLRNLTRFWERTVTPDDIETGSPFYSDHHKMLKQLARFYGAPFVQTVEAFAVLSPNTDLTSNLRSTASCLWALRTKQADPPRVTTFNRGRDAAMAFLTGDASFLDSVGGAKITAFRHNVLYPWSDKHVTVDGHMVAILENRDLDMRGALRWMREHRNGPAAIYPTYEKTLRTFAKRHSMVPSMMQAVLWTARRRSLSSKHSQKSIDFKDPRHYPPILDDLDLKAWRAWAERRLAAVSLPR